MKSAVESTVPEPSAAFRASRRPHGCGLRVIVIGRGPTGQATALSLAALKRRHPTLEWLQVGAYMPRQDPRGVEIGSNGFAALGAIEVRTDDPAIGSAYDLAKDVGYSLERYDFRGADGRVLWSMPVGTLARELGHASRVVSIRDLAHALQPKANLVEQDARHVISRQDDAFPHVLVRTRDQLLYTDLVVLADGRRSRLRRKASDPFGHPLFPEAPWKTSRLVAVVGQTRIRHEWAEPGAGFVLHGDDIRFSGWPAPSPGDQQWLAWMAFVPRHVVLDPRIGNRTLVRGDPAIRHQVQRRVQERLTRALDCLASPAAEFVRLTPLSPVRAPKDDKPLLVGAMGRVVRRGHQDQAPHGRSLAIYPLEDRDPDTPWYSCGVTLMGDAAHPMLPDLGQSCGLAFEDVVRWMQTLDATLANGHIAQNPTDLDRVANAMHRWQAMRATRVRELHFKSRMASLAAHLPVSASLRDLSIEHFAPKLVVRDFKRILAWRP